ncbi:DNA-binding transcriptional regulator [Micromonospora echinospora]|uniref:Predicted DNA-binding transcriptional regulator YafY, contains an HTH and WYL domains n=1 Tax=Micromonospora echinospora TaxID=1877 RepID=A0A1C4ZWU8_MICEC|nr:YafY family protein [Micromonospora echinospora]OZV83930.1 DNA-binding transcriptional regulator [Micromonospora echinospora]SCF37440.1 Predicted DNA-binding transcriptional regulator YafY, contains an HTH and WYL domains [Micromonospora echinospora]
MIDGAGRLLALLSLLQARRDWSGTELAARLGVTTRTVRRDVTRLRELGYPVHAAPGTAGYRLGAGRALPPLLLDDEEAVAVAVGLRTAAIGSVTGMEEASLRALGKLEQVLPARLRHRVAALHRTTVRADSAGAGVDPAALLAVAEACHRHERLRFAHTGADGKVSVRSVEPQRLVSHGRHWYLVAWDVDRDDWRCFRLDRMEPRTPTGPRFAPRADPDGDVVAYLNQRLSTWAWPVRATVVLDEPAATVAARIWPGMGVVEAVDAHRCRLHVGAENANDLVWMVTSLGVGFTVVDGPPDLTTALRAHAARCLRAVDPAW